MPAVDTPELEIVRESVVVIIRHSEMLVALRALPSEVAVIVEWNAYVEACLSTILAEELNAELNVLLARLKTLL